MKNFLTGLTFLVLFAGGIFLDSLAVNLICSMFPKLAGTWLTVTQVTLWTLLSALTGGLVFAISFLIAGAIRTSVS
jgi:hypothetical protein